MVHTSEHTGINVGGTSLQGTERVGNSTACVVVEVRLNITRDHTPQSPDQIVHLSWRRTADSVGNTDTVHAGLVHSAVESQEVHQV